MSKYFIKIVLVNILTPLILCFFSYNSFAGFWPVPVAVETTLEPNGTKSYKVLGWQNVEVGAWTALPTERPCLSVGLRFLSSSGRYSFATFRKHCAFYSNADRAHALDLFLQRFGLDNDFPASFTGDNRDDNVCVALGFHQTDFGSSSYFDTTQFPASGCTEAPPGLEWCRLKTPLVEFDHGTLSTRTTSNLSSVLDVECTSDMTVILDIGKPSFDLANGVHSTLSFDGVGSDGKVDLKQGTNNLVLNNTLVVDEFADKGSFIDYSLIQIFYP